MIRIGISACLLGEKVRWDGGDKKMDRFLMDTLKNYLDFVPICPEVGSGLPVPRESMRLEGDPAMPRLVTFHTRIDLTGRVLAWARKRIIDLQKEDLHGFIFKSGSPSCGLSQVPVTKGAEVEEKGVGIFAKAFMEGFPLLPVEDEVAIGDPAARRKFLKALGIRI